MEDFTTGMENASLLGEIRSCSFYERDRGETVLHGNFIDSMILFDCRFIRGASLDGGHVGSNEALNAAIEEMIIRHKISNQNIK
jgi:hypothetical protein